MDSVISLDDSGIPKPIVDRHSGSCSFLRVNVLHFAAGPLSVTWSNIQLRAVDLVCLTYHVLLCEKPRKSNNIYCIYGTLAIDYVAQAILPLITVN